jgi:hypothetical protein
MRFPPMLRMLVVATAAATVLVEPSPAYSADPCVWTRVAIPHASIFDPVGIDARARDDVWAVGHQPGSGAAHWDGAQWQAVPFPGSADDLFASTVDVRSPHDAWVVGWANSFDPLARQRVILHWDGSRWSPTRIQGLTGVPFLSGVEGVTSNRAWAVGVVTDARMTTQRGLVLRWNGRVWRPVDVPLPRADRWSSLADVQASGPRDVWAAGSINELIDDPDRGWTNPVSLHWDGATWTRVPMQRTRRSYENLGALELVARDDIWAVGGTGGPHDEIGASLVQHWDGSAWSSVAHPRAGAGPDALTGVAASGADDVWAVGYDFHPDTTSSPSILHWNGTSWVPESIPSPPRDRTYLWDATALPSGEAWIAGRSYDESAATSWVLHRTC